MPAHQGLFAVSFLTVQPSRADVPVIILLFCSIIVSCVPYCSHLCASMELIRLIVNNMSTLGKVFNTSAIP